MHGQMRRPVMAPASAVATPPRRVGGPIRRPIGRDAESTARGTGRPLVGGPNVQLAPLDKDPRPVPPTCASACACNTCAATRAPPSALAPAVQRADGANPSSARPSPGEALGELGHGEPLPSHVASPFSSSYGRDLSGVQIHTNSALAASMGARAFTVGHHVAFAPGHYRPESRAGRRLVGHELAHVVQQAGGAGAVQGAGLDYDRLEAQADGAADAAMRGEAAHFLAPAPSSIQRDDGPADGGSLPGGVSTPPPSRTCDPAGRALLATEVVELQGAATFSPSQKLGDFLFCMTPDPFPVKVRFGSLASGTIDVRAVGVRNFETTSALPLIALTHPALPRGSAALVVNVDGNVVTGRILWGLVATTTTAITRETTTYDFGLFNVTRTDVSVSRLTTVGDLTPSENQLGWKGLRNLQLAPVVNQLAGGTLVYAAVFDFLLDAGFPGAGVFALVNGGQSFSATARIGAAGVPEQDMRLERASDNNIFGSVALSYDMAPRDTLGGKLSGSLRGSFANGRMNITGSAQYASPRLSGTVTIMLADEATAWVSTLLQMPPSAAMTANPGLLDATRHVVVGWGTVDFAFNEWLTGTASVVVDPKGFITSHGAIRPNKAFTFLTDETLAGRKQLGPTVSASAFLPVWGPTGITGSIEGSLFAAGRVGPGTIHDMELAGVVSTRPDVPLSVSLSGVVDLSAIGRLELDLTGSLSYTLVGKHLKTVSIEVNVNGTAALKVYARLEPTFTVTRASNGDFTFNLHGVLKAAAGVDLGLSGSIHLSAPIIGGPKFSTGKYNWHVGGIGVKTTLDYTIGDKSLVDLDFERYKYDPTEFHNEAERLLDNSAEKDKLRGNDHSTEVRGASAPDRPVMALPAPQKFDFEMNRARHQLWLEPSPRPVVKMASGEGPLSGKLGAESSALTAEETSAAGTEHDLVQAEQGEVKELLSQTAAVESSAQRVQASDKPTPDVAGVQELAAAIGAYGDQFQKTDLATLGKTSWKPPKGWNGPVNHGRWERPDAPGDSGWIDDRPEVIRVVKINAATSEANPIPFQAGIVDFSRWSQGDLRVTGLKGDHANDMGLIRDAIADRYDLLPTGSRSARREAALAWLRDAADGYGGKGLRPHHAGGSLIQLIPKDLHKVQHTDLATYEKGE